MYNNNYSEKNDAKSTYKNTRNSRVGEIGQHILQAGPFNYILYDQDFYSDLFVLEVHFSSSSNTLMEKTSDSKDYFVS